MYLWLFSYSVSLSEVSSSRPSCLDADKTPRPERYVRLPVRLLFSSAWRLLATSVLPRDLSLLLLLDRKQLVALALVVVIVVLVAVVIIVVGGVLRQRTPTPFAPLLIRTRLSIHFGVSTLPSSNHTTPHCRD